MFMSMMNQVHRWSLTGKNVEYGFHTKRYVKVAVETSLIMNMVVVCVLCVHMYAGKRLCGFYLSIKLVLTKNIRWQLERLEGWVALIEK